MSRTQKVVEQALKHKPIEPLNPARIAELKRIVADLKHWYQKALEQYDVAPDGEALAHKSLSHNTSGGKDAGNQNVVRPPEIRFDGDCPDGDDCPENKMLERGKPLPQVPPSLILVGSAQGVLEVAVNLASNSQ